MNEPKFAVGEVVMVRTIYNPEINCDWAVVERILSGSFTGHITGKTRMGFSYFIEHDNRLDDAGRRISISELALRKRPKPYGDFTEMMTDLKSGKTVEMPA